MTGSVYHCCDYYQKPDSHQWLHLGVLFFNGVEGSQFLSDAPLDSAHEVQTGKLHMRE